MSYKELPLEERIQRASEYALILISNDTQQIDTINDLMETFDLTESQAKQAYTLMREKFRSQFETATKSKIRLAWLVIITTPIIIAFFAFVSTEMGIIYLICAFLFGLIFIASVISLAYRYRERFLSPEQGYLSDRDREKKLASASGKDENGSWTVGMPIFLLLFTCITFYLYYSHSSVVDIKDIIVKSDLIISDGVEFRQPKKKQASFTFRFRGIKHEFLLFSDFYDFGKWRLNKDDFSIGDTLTIEMTRKGLSKFKSIHERSIKVTNIAIDGQWLIDHSERNKNIEKRNKNNLIFSLLSFTGCLIAAYFWLRFRKRKTTGEKVD